MTSLFWVWLPSEVSRLVFFCIRIHRHNIGVKGKPPSYSYMSMETLILSILQCRPHRVNLFTGCNITRFEILPSHITLLHPSDLEPNPQLASALLASDVQEFNTNNEDFTNGLLGEFDVNPQIRDSISLVRRTPIT